MGLVRFDGDAENLVAGAYSQGRGPVLRSEHLELTKIAFAKGEGAKTHQHEEDQVLYLLSGRMRATSGEETFEVGPGEAIFNRSGIPHSVVAIEDSVGLSFKNQVAPAYPATGELS